MQNWLVLFSETVLLLYLAVAFLVNRYRVEKTAKTFFTLGKYFVSVSLLSSLIFYDKSVFPSVWQNTAYTALFKVMIYLVALFWFYLSSKWFLNKNRSSYAYYSLCIAALLLFEILLSARNFAVPSFIVPGLCLITGCLLLQNGGSEEGRRILRLYVFFAVLFCLFLWIGTGILQYYVGSLDYETIETFLQKGDFPLPPVYGAVILILSSLLFMMAAAPFHLCFVSIIRTTILPVAGFLTLIPPFVYLSCLISLMLGVFSPFENMIRPLLLSFAVFSLIIGAFSANGQKNIRELFAFSSVFNLGFMLFGLISFSNTSVIGAFDFTLIYILSMFGVYTVFLGIKSRGDYLFELEDLSGMAGEKPYLSAALLIFMVSLIGIPPMIGFLGRLSVINNLVLEERWGHMLLLVVALLFMANAYLQIIRVIYFEPQKQKFDRTGKAVYICLFANLLLIFISIFNPGYLLRDAETILNGVFG